VFCDKGIVKRVYCGTGILCQLRARKTLRVQKPKSAVNLCDKVVTGF